MTVKQLASDLGVTPDEVAITLFCMDAPGITWDGVVTDSVFDHEVPLGYHLGVAKKMINARDKMIKQLQKGKQQ
jgi:hypothetical protein